MAWGPAEFPRRGSPSASLQRVRGRNRRQQRRLYPAEAAAFGEQALGVASGAMPATLFGAKNRNQLLRGVIQDLVHEDIVEEAIVLDLA